MEELKKTRLIAKRALTRNVNCLKRLVAEEDRTDVIEGMDTTTQSFKEFENHHRTYHATLKEDKEIEKDHQYFCYEQDLYQGAIKAAQEWLGCEVKTETNVDNLLSCNPAPRIMKPNCPCPLCSENHRLFYCDMFKALKPHQRLEVVKLHKLCENCLLKFHTADHCFKPSVCSVRGCGKKHTMFVHVTDLYSNPSSSERNKQLHTHPCNDLKSVQNGPVIPVEVISQPMTVTTLKEDTDSRCADEHVTLRASTESESQIDAKCCDNIEIADPVDKTIESKAASGVKTDSSSGKFHPKLDSSRTCRDQVMFYALLLLLSTCGVMSPVCLISLLMFRDLSINNSVWSIAVHKDLKYVCNIMATVVDIVLGYSENMMKFITWISDGG